MGGGNNHFDALFIHETKTLKKNIYKHNELVMTVASIHRFVLTGRKRNKLMTSGGI